MEPKFRGLRLGGAYKHSLILVFAVILVSVVLYLAYGVSVSSTMRVIAGLVYLLFLPGFLLSLLVFPGNKEITSMGRVGLSFGLSIPVTLTTVVFVDMVLGLPITSATIIQSLGVLMAAMLAVWIVRYKITSRKNNP